MKKGKKKNPKGKRKEKNPKGKFKRNRKEEEN